MFPDPPVSWIRRHVVTVVLSVMAVGCGESQLDQLRRIAPDVDEELARHLVYDDETTFFAYCEALGHYKLLRALPSVWDTYRQTTLNDFRRTAAIVDPYQLRLVRALANVFANRQILERIRKVQALSMEQRFFLLRFDAEIRAYPHPEHPTEEDLEPLLRFFTVADSIGLHLGESYLALRIVDVMEALGRDQDARSWNWKAVEELIAAGNVNMACQTLGTLGSTYRGLARTDSMRICWDRALKIALRSRIADQAARIYEFYGNYYWRLGKLAAAFDLYRQAVEVCRDFKGGSAELRFLLNILDCHAEFGCWDLVGRDLPRGHVLAAGIEETEEPFLVQLSLMEGRYLMATGRLAAADSVFARTVPRALDVDHLDFAVDGIYHWGVGLLQSGFPERTLDKVRMGLEHGEGLANPHVRNARFHLLAAKARLVLGQYEEAEEERRQFRQVSQAHDLEAHLRIPWIEHDALSVRLAMADGSRRQAMRRLRRGFARLRRYLATVDASAEGYLFLERVRDLRTAMHEVVADDPELGYALEMAWRRNALLLGSGSPGSQSRPITTGLDERGLSSDGASDTTWMSSHDSRRLRGWLEHDDMHVVYWVAPERVVRWTATRTGVSREQLAIPVDGLRALTLDAIEALATPHSPDAPSDPDLAAELFTLGEALLPRLPPVAGERPPTLLVSPDGFLDALSFEALNVVEPGYTPLLRVRDVAYLRHLLPWRRRTEGPDPGIAVVDPLPPRSIQRRHQGIPRLERGGEEVRELADLVPGLTVLAGQGASRARLVDSWEGARVLYFATHVLRDQEAPYLSYMAMSGPDSAAEESYLGISDVRVADLSGCRLVALSACASGAPFVTPTFSGASLADAFLDAGAGTAVRTLWKVRDADAPSIMGRFMQHWIRENAPPIQALADARRERMGERAWPPHPFSWAAYGIEIACLPER